MEKITLSQSEEQISKSDLTDLEQECNITLPDNYKKLLLKFNGGVTYEHEYLFELMSIKYGKYTVKELYRDSKITEKNLPDDYFPFAVTGTGNIITININHDSEYGKIFVFFNDRVENKKISNSLEELMGVEDIDDL